MQCLAQRLIAGVLLGACLFGDPADAFHQNVGSFGPALRPCSPEEADVVTLLGVPACSGARRLSDCAADPGAALRQSPIGIRVNAFRIAPLDPRYPGYALDEDARFRFLGIDDCSGQAWTGETTIALGLRLTIHDPACAGGICTVPDITLPHPLPCEDGRCEARHLGAPLLAAIGLPPLPTDMPWSAEGVSLGVLDRAGNRMLSPWLSLARGDDSASYGLLSRTVRSAWRLVRAFPECSPAAVNTVTSAGLPACAGLPPLSDCASDPGNAISSASRPRRSTLKLYGAADGIRYAVELSDLLDCAGLQYEGPVALVAILRAIIDDPLCGGTGCTTVDTPVQVEIGVSRGRASVRGTLALALGARVLGVELVRLEVRDRANHPVLVAPGINVTCGLGACYGS